MRTTSRRRDAMSKLRNEGDVVVVVDEGRYLCSHTVRKAISTAVSIKKSIGAGPRVRSQIIALLQSPCGVLPFLL